MPNWCSNQVTMTGPKEKIDEIVSELKKSDERDTPYEILNVIRPRPAEEEENWYAWNIENWGTKWDVNIYGYEVVDENTVSLSFDSAWAPPIALYEYLVENEWEVEAYYHEPGMCFCGHYNNGYDDYYDYSNMTADELADTLPSELDEMFNISEDMRMWEEENEE